jgi:hypothetical protein
MKDDLEKYLTQKRKEMDVETPEDSIIWEGIRGTLHRKEVRPARSSSVSTTVRILRIAAVVFILFSVGYITRDIIGKRSEVRVIRLADISKVLGEKEKQYVTMVNLKSEEVRAYESTDNMIIRELFEEIRRLDVVYDQSLKDLKEIGYNEKIINTIFDTYEKKIHLLELIILESNKTGSHENSRKINL